MEKRQTVELGDEEILSSDSKITLSNIKIKRQYMVDVAIFSEQQYIGDIIPVPDVLIKYLNATELRIFTIILGQLKTHTSSMVRRKSIAKELGVSTVTVSNVMTSLEKMGIIVQEQHGRRKFKTINFGTIQKLSDILKDKLPGAVHAFREVMGDCSIKDPKPTALALLELQYTEHEGEENEEYAR